MKCDMLNFAALVFTRSTAIMRHTVTKIDQTVVIAKNANIVHKNRWHSAWLQSSVGYVGSQRQAIGGDSGAALVTLVLFAIYVWGCSKWPITAVVRKSSEIRRCNELKEAMNDRLCGVLCCPCVCPTEKLETSGEIPTEVVNTSSHIRIWDKIPTQIVLHNKWHT
jgi:hypothetical protein